MKNSVTIDDTVRAHLLAMRWQGNIAVLAGQLERKTYEAVNKIIELAGGKWSRKDKGHVFDENGQEIIASAIETGAILDEKKMYQFFATPATLADRMVEMLCPSSEDTILEPSAGTGALVQALLRAGVHKNQITAIELNEANGTRHIQNVGFVTRGDFMDYKPGKQFSKIIANPPFSNGQDVEHATKMWDLLAPGGRMVCITSPAWKFRTGARWTKFRELINSLGANASVESLEPGTFAESGTNVNTLLLTLRK